MIVKPYVRPKRRPEDTLLIRGDEGEQKVARSLDRHFGPSDHYMVLHDLRIRHSDVTVQIDHLVVSMTARAAWLFETKNLSGRISVNDRDEWTASQNGRPYFISSPVEQATTAARLVETLLKEFSRITDVVPVVVFPYSTEVDWDSMPYDKHVIKSDGLDAWRDRMHHERSLLWVSSMIWHQMRARKNDCDLTLVARELASRDLRTLRSTQPTITESTDIDSFGVYLKQTGLGLAVKFNPENANVAEALKRISIQHGDMMVWNDQWSNWILHPNKRDLFVAALREEMSR